MTTLQYNILVSPVVFLLRTPVSILSFAFTAVGEFLEALSDALPGLRRW